MTLALSLPARLTALVTVGAVTVAVGVGIHSDAAVAAPTPRPPVRSITVGSNPYDIAISQSLGKAFVVDDGGVSVVSLLTRRKIADFDTDGFQGQNAITLVRGNRQGYITNYDKPTVAVFDTETHRVTKQIQIGAGAVDVVKANTPRGQRAYASVLRRSQVVAIKTSTATVVQRITLPEGAQTLAARPDGKTVWAGSVQRGRIWVIDTVRGKVTKTLNVDRSGPINSIAFAPGAKKAWVAGLGGVSVVSTRTGKTTRFISTAELFTGQDANMGKVAITGSGRYALVSNQTWPDDPQRGQVSLLDTRSGKIIWRISTGYEPVGLGLDNRRNLAYTTNFADDTVSWFSVPD